MGQLLQKFANKLKELRKQKNLTQEDLATDSDISRSTIAMVEAQRRDVTLDKIEKISNALGIEPKELFEFDK